MRFHHYRLGTILYLLIAASLLMVGCGEVEEVSATKQVMPVKQFEAVYIVEDEGVKSNQSSVSSCLRNGHELFQGMKRKSRKKRKERRFGKGHQKKNQASERRGAKRDKKRAKKTRRWRDKWGKSKQRRR